MLVPEASHPSTPASEMTMLRRLYLTAVATTLLLVPAAPALAGTLNMG